MVRIFRYCVPSLPEGYGGWGVFMLDSTGFFAASTDYGNYMYHWPRSFNGDFREFVAYSLCSGRGDDYILRKVFREDPQAGKTYNDERTVQNIKQCLIENRRTDNISKEDAREMWDEIGIQNDLATEHDFDNWYGEVAHIDGEAYQYRVMEWSVQSLAFCDELLPRLRPLILAELDSERVRIIGNGVDRIEYREVRA